MDLKKNKLTTKLKDLHYRIRLKIMMPNLDKYKKKYSDSADFEEKYVVMSKEEFQLIKKLGNNLESHLNQIKLNNQEIENLKDTNNGMILLIKNTLIQLKEKETARRKAAGKVGGLTASLNKEKEKKEQLLKDKIDLENTIELKNNEIKLKELEIQEKETEIKILKNLGKKKQIEDYKKLKEIKKDIDNQKRIRGVNYD